MKLKEAFEKIQTSYGNTYFHDDEGSSSKMERWSSLLKDGDPLRITDAVNEIPRIEVASMIKKLGAIKYKDLPGTEVAISKLKWRRGY